LSTARDSKKLDYKYIGLFEVIRVVNDVVYTLELPDDIKIYPTFYVSILEDYIEAEYTKRD